MVRKLDVLGLNPDGMHVGLFAENFSNFQLQQVILKTYDWEGPAYALLEQGPCLEIIFREICGNRNYLDFVSDLHLSFTVRARRL